MYVHTYACMDVCMYACLYVLMYVCMDVCMHAGRQACVHAPCAGHACTSEFLSQGYMQNSLLNPA